MTTSEFSFTISSKGFGDIIDITSKVESFLQNSGCDKAIIYIYNYSNDVAIKNIEIKELEQKMKDKSYQSLIQAGNSNMLILPVIDKMLYKNEMSRILFVDFEQSASVRKIIVMFQT